MGTTKFEADPDAGLIDGSDLITLLLSILVPPFGLVLATIRLRRSAGRSKSWAVCALVIGVVGSGVWLVFIYSLISPLLGTVLRLTY
jgi:hypothetical protein